MGWRSRRGVSSYQYNGLGDRLSQTVNGVTTNYTLDLNSGLTQVLDDETNVYVYGLGRISQTSTTTEYFLGDALGSVRQLTNNAGEVTLAKSYAPYGEVTQSGGAGQSAYGFTGEMTDATGLTYLRARYYNPADGRFLSRDTWGGDYRNPITLNKWSYAHGNPVKFTDPSGHDPWWCQYTSNPEQCEEDYWNSWNIRCSTPEPTPPSALTNWEITHGQAIANAAKEIYANRDNYYVWGAIYTDDEWYVNPPPREIPADGFIWNGVVNVKERTGGRIPIVCADIVAMSYENAGYKLSTTFPDWANNSGYETDPERSVPALYNLLSACKSINPQNDLLRFACR